MLCVNIKFKIFKIDLLEFLKFTMGCELTKELIIKSGNLILDEFFSKSMLGQLFTALSAQTTCKNPAKDEKISEYMRCQFLKSQKSACEYIAIQQLILIFTIGLLSLVLYKKTKKVVTTFNQQANNRILNVQIASGSAQLQDRVRPLVPKRVGTEPVESIMNEASAWRSDA